MLAPSLAKPPSHDEIMAFLETSPKRVLLREGAESFVKMGLKVGIKALDLREREKLEIIIAKLREASLSSAFKEDVEKILEVFILGEKFLQSSYSKVISEIPNFLQREDFPPFLKTEVLIIATNCHQALENVEEAFETASLAVKMADVEGNEWRRIHAMTRLANAIFLQRNYSLAESMFRHLRNINSFDDDFYVFLFANNLGASLFHQGKIKEALKELETALLYADTGKTSNIMRGIIHQNIGEANLILNRTEDAKTHLLESKRLLEQDYSVQIIHLADTLLLLVETLTLRNEMKEVSAILSEFRELLVQSPDNIAVRTRYLTGKAIFELSRANFTFATELLRKGVELEEGKIQNPNLLLWRLHAFVSLILYQFSRDRAHLEVAKKRILKLKEIGLKSSYAHLLAQIHYLCTLLGYFSRDKDMFTTELKNAKMYAKMLPSSLKKRYLILLNSLDYPSGDPVHLSLEDIFQIALPIEWGNHEVIPKHEGSIDHVALFSIKDFVGPEILFDSGKIDDRDFIYRQGAFLVALIGVGDLYAEGFWGPMPTPNPEYVVYVRTKKVPNSLSSDPRKDKWTYLLLTFFSHETASSSTRIALSLKKSSEEVFASIRNHQEVKETKWREWLAKLEEEIPMKK